MTSNEIRKKYIEFFVKKGHQEIPPAPIVPPDDPTTLFTNSGMQQLVPYLKGETHSMGKRLVDSQPCFRAEDIEEVGDNRHTTFYEMLGNWSLGDYFKKEQLPWNYEFLTDTIGLDPERLYVSVFAGSKIAPKDQESIKIWQELFQSKEPAQLGEKEFNTKTKIYLYDATKNWWSRVGVPENMPTGEVGGTTSEVFFDNGQELKFHENSPYKAKPCHINCDCGRFLEICNSVFMEYEKQKDGSFKTLPEQNVDFGGGLERITAASNNNPDVFKTELFSKAIKSLEALTKSGDGYKKNPRPYRIITDHLRAAIFMSAEGLISSNKQQGYILRRLIRRAMVYARKLGMVGDEWLSNCLPFLSSPYIKSYPIINKKIPEISENITKEIDKFRITIDKGLREFEKTPIDHIDEKFAFNSLATYGMPFEITQELAQDKGKQLDKSIFEHYVKKHQELSRSGASGMFKGGLADKSSETIKFHTATHLLHKVLRDVLGDHVRQEGSNITAKRLRFDFRHSQALTKQETVKVEKIINKIIKKNLPVHKTIEDREKALDSGALAFFKETYPQKVSVYTIGKDPDKNWFSKEFCGGPHVKFTGEIGKIKITKEQSIGSGIRRIYAELVQ